ncbi:MAG: MFS transporter [Candidatus Eremiobacteraeota bacterium]|nr:MFS transporter [Candidatus Eremiobacteraeota bacterium]
MEHRRWTALVVLCMGVLMVVVDQTIVNVALPAIQRDLGFTQSGLAWVVNAYLIAYGGLLLLAGRLGDLLGRKRVFVAGLILFTLASILCGLSENRTLLVVARFVQGLAGAGSGSVILGMIVTMFPDPREQGRAIGIFSFVAATGGSIGLLAGGILTQTLSWHWIFLVNVPIGILTVLAALRLVDDEPGLGIDRGADVAGAALVTSSLMLGIYTIVETDQYGWLSAHTLGLGALALVLFGAFLARQATAREPLVPLRVFRGRTLVGANLTAAFMVVGFFSFFFLGTLYLQRVLQYDALQIGLAILPVPTVIGALSLRASAQLNIRFGARNVLLTGLGLSLFGLVWLARAPVGGTYLVDILPSMLLLGFGAGIAFPALMTLAMADATPSDAGLASGLISTTQMVGGALGLAVIVTVAASRTASLLAAGASQAAALTGGYHLGFDIGAVLLGASILVAATVIAPPDRRGEGAAAPHAAWDAD